jgi:hypothetical protein
MKNRYTLIFFTLITSFLTAQTTVNFSTAEGYNDGTQLDDNLDWGAEYFIINTTDGTVRTPSNYTAAYWGQSQTITEGETITFEVDMKFEGDLSYANAYIAQIGFNAGGTTSTNANERQWISLKALTNGKLKIEKRGGGNLSSTPSYLEGWTIDTWKDEDLTFKVSFKLGNSAATSVITAKLINNTTGEYTDASFEDGVEANVYNEAVNGNLYGFFRTAGIEDSDDTSTEILYVSRVKLVNEDTLFPSIFFNTNADWQWGTAANWDPAYVPTSYTDVKILVNQSIQIASSTTALANNIVVNSGGSLTIDQTSSLTVSDDFENNGTVTLNSGGSLIVNGTSSGDVTYNRTLGTDNWYLMSSPVAGETYNNAYANDNSLATSGTKRGLAAYNTELDTWTYLENDDSNSASFTSGKGYSFKRASTGLVSFTGTLNVADAGVDVVLDATGQRFNLLGNPYTSHIASATFLATEAAVLDVQNLWVWNQATGASGAYEVKIPGDAMLIAPAQGFFVKANAAGGTFNFAESNQAGSGGTFQKTEARPEMHLTLSNQSDVREAKIYYIENMTLGFDVGYEGELFNGVANPLAIYTHLVADSEGKNYQVQSLPDNDFEDTIIPLGINAISGSSISIKASKNNFPEGMNIYLEDKQDNSFTLLEADANFNTTLENDLSGIGRFFIHTTSSTLSANDLAISNNLSIYSSNRETLRVVGVQNGTANLQIFNLLGKEVLRSSFEGSGVNDIALPKLTRGVYIAKITTEHRTTNRKIILE